MVSAVNATLRSPTLSIVGGRFVRPLWRREMAPRTWRALSGGTKISQVNPANSPAHNPDGGTPIWAGTGGQRNVIDAWSGAILDPTTEEMIIFGGGHGDYGGNEAYRIRLNRDAPLSELIYAPAGAGLSGQTSAYLAATSPAPASLGTYPDGKPRSQHTYDKITYAPGYMWLVRNNGGFPDGQHGDNRTWRMALATGVWDSPCAFASISGRVAGARDTLRNRLWAFQDQADDVAHMDLGNPVSGWTWIANPGGETPPSENHYLCATYLAAHDLFLITSGRHTLDVESAVLIYDPVTHIYYRPTLTGAVVTDTLLNMGYSHPAYVPAENACYLWDNIAHRQNLIKLQLGSNPRTDAIVKSIVVPHESNTVTPPERATDGTYGRLQYSERMNCLYLLNDVNEHVHAFALS